MRRSASFKGYTRKLWIGIGSLYVLGLTCKYLIFNRVTDYVKVQRSDLHIEASKPLIASLTEEERQDLRRKYIDAASLELVRPKEGTGIGR